MLLYSVINSIYSVLISLYSVLMSLYAVLSSVYSVLIPFGASFVIFGAHAIMFGALFLILIFPFSNISGAIFSFWNTSIRLPKLCCLPYISSGLSSIFE